MTEHAEYLTVRLVPEKGKPHIVGPDTIQFYTFDCPACFRPFKLKAWAVEVFRDGLEITCPLCGRRLIMHLEAQS